MTLEEIGETFDLTRERANNTDKNWTNRKHKT
jgi:DNA-directed RNA polymerase sigma subunit (sigma70/sigma32)